MFADAVHAPRPAPRPPLKANAKIEPLSEARYSVQLTASAELRDKIERATRLMRHRNPDGDLAVVFDRALDLLLAELEKERLGKTNKPRKSPPAASPEHVSSAARREVFARDGEQCAFVSESGERCTSQAFLEIDHVHPRARGGGSEPSNLRILCRPHNLLAAERAFGREHVSTQIRMRQRGARGPTTTSCATSATNATTGSRDPSAPRMDPPAPAHVAPPEGGLSSRSSSSKATTPAASTLEIVARALVSLGFREADARRALRTVTSRDEGSCAGAPVESILRDALAILT
jgi:5-methylcytosine-specific restriction endonuclease McrA